MAKRRATPTPTIVHTMLVRVGSTACWGQSRLGRRRRRHLRFGWERAVRRRLLWHSGFGPLCAHDGSLAPVSTIVFEPSRHIGASTSRPVTCTARGLGKTVGYNVWVKAQTYFNGACCIGGDRVQAARLPL